MSLVPRRPDIVADQIRNQRRSRNLWNRAEDYWKGPRRGLDGSSTPIVRSPWAIEQSVSISTNILYRRNDMIVGSYGITSTFYVTAPGFGYTGGRGRWDALPGNPPWVVATVDPEFAPRYEVFGENINVTPDGEFVITNRPPDRVDIPPGATTSDAYQSAAYLTPLFWPQRRGW